MYLYLINIICALQFLPFFRMTFGKSMFTVGIGTYISRLVRLDVIEVIIVVSFC